MTTNQRASNGNTGLTGLFNSMVGFSYASFMYGLRFLFTNPMEMPERARLSLDRVSDALNKSMPAKHEMASQAANQEVRAGSLNETVRASAEAATGDDREAAEMLSGRKR